MPESLQIVAALLALIGHTVLWVALVNRVHAFAIDRRIVDGVTLLCGLLLVGLPLWAAQVVWTGGGPDALRANAFWWWYGLAMAPLAIVAAGWRAYLSIHPERRGVVVSSKVTRCDFRQRYGLELASPIPRAFSRLPGNQVLSLAIEEKRLAVPRLPEALEGLKIAHLADLHLSGRFGVEMFRDIMNLTNDWDPDLVALTGDLVEKDQCLPWIDQTYGRLRAPLGVFFVLGNHDKKCNHTRMRELLVAAGVVDVGGRSKRVTKADADIEIVGNELPWFRPPGQFSGDDLSGSDRAFRLVLAHGPDQFGWAVRRDADLILAGHNHGGQVRFPPLGALLTPSLHGTRYNCGSFRRGRTVMHVTRGTGSLAPFRFFCPPELSLLTLQRGNR